MAAWDLRTALNPLGGLLYLSSPPGERQTGVSPLLTLPFCAWEFLLGPWLAQSLAAWAGLGPPSAGLGGWYLCLRIVVPCFFQLYRETAYTVWIQGSPTGQPPGLSPHSCRMGMIPRQFIGIRCEALTAPKLEATTCMTSTSLAVLVTCLEGPKCHL